MEWWWWGKPDSNRVGLFLIRTRDWDIVFEREVYVCLPGKMRIISRSNDVVRTNKETSLDPVLMNERVKSSFSNLISHRQETTTDILNHVCLLCIGKLIRATFGGFYQTPQWWHATVFLDSSIKMDGYYQYSSEILSPLQPSPSSFVPSILEHFLDFSASIQCIYIYISCNDDVRTLNVMWPL